MTSAAQLFTATSSIAHNVENHSLDEQHNNSTETVLQSHEPPYHIVFIFGSFGVGGK